MVPHHTSVPEEIIQQLYECNILLLKTCSFKYSCCNDSEASNRHDEEERERQRVKEMQERQKAVEEERDAELWQRRERERETQNC